MNAGDAPDAAVVEALRDAVKVLTEREQLAEQRLVAVRRELAGRDETFTMLEERRWQRFADHERHSLQTVAKLEAERDALRDQLATRERELIQLRVLAHRAVLPRVRGGGRS